MHATQAPPLHTWLAPHEVPFLAGFGPVSTHTDVPDAQELCPLSQMLTGVQLAPALQTTHAPPLQAALAPQAVPFGAGPMSTHTAVPVAQDV